MMAPVRTFVVVLVVFGVLTQAFQTPLVPKSRVKLQQTQRTDTLLHMGLRTFIKTKLGREKDENGAESKNGAKKKKKPAAEKPKGISIPKEPVTAEITTEEVTMTNKDSRLPPLRQESVKDKVTRVRSGQMTEDEKQAFLRTALSAGDTSTSRKPLRQALPDESRPSNSTSNATPMPKDSLLGNMARGWGNGANNTDPNDLPLRNWKDGATMEDQKKKREYFDMVTDPNRFHTYKGSMVTAPGETDKVDPTVHDGLVIPQAGEEEEMDEREVILEEEVLEDIKAYEQNAEVDGDLGTRLEKAAHALEEAAKLKEIERKEKEERLEREREEQKARLAEIQTKQRLDMEKRELEIKAKKREEEEARTAEMERKRKEEEARRRKLEEAQDTYWAKQLKAEKEARMEGMSQRQKDEFVKHEVQAEVKAMKIAEQEKEALEAMEQGAQKLDGVEAQIDIAAADYLTKETATDSTYEAIREKKRLEAEQARDEQIARLKALNSPLPAPSSRAPPTASPVVPPASFASRGASELSNLKSQPEPAPAPPAELPKTEATIADMMNDVVEEDIEEVAVESSAGSGFLKRVLGGSSKKETAAPKAPEPRRVVRQELPLGDEEDDFDTFDRNGPNREMSIGDAMSNSGGSSSGGDQEQRSRMWGVDMSRIAKSLEDEKKAG